MKKIIIPVLIIGVIGILVGVFFFQTNKLDQLLKNDEIEQITLSELEDGTYHGIYETNLVSVEVDVYVSENQITDIQIIRHDTMLGKDAEAIINDIVLNQSLDVDSIAGATYSSEVIKRAVEDALKTN